MTQHEFQQLAEKYLRGDCTPQEEHLMQVWADQTLTDSPTVLPPTEQREAGRKLWAQIAARTTAPPMRILRNRWSWFTIAAAVCLCALGGWWLWQLNEKNTYLADSSRAQLPGVIDVRNTSLKPQSITLEDGSIVVLKPNSSLSYPEHFGTRTRSILLNGEAFFNVRRDPTKPFRVHTGDLITEVLGTSFTIRSYDNAPAIEVLVKTGRVSVFEAAHSAVRQRNGLILTPNQKVTFDKRLKTLQPSLTDLPTPVTPPPHRQAMVFNDAPLTDVVARLQAVYGIEIVLGNQQLALCQITADLNDLPLHTQLDLLCRSVEATYEQRGTSIFINGDGCR